MAGKSPDRIPWIPRMLLWYNAHKKAGTLPKNYKSYTLREVERDLGMGTPARDGAVFKTIMRNVEVVTHERGRDRLTEYITPAGTVSSRESSTEELDKADIQKLEVEHVIKRPEDYGVVEYMVEHTDYVPAYEGYLSYDKEIGEDGVPMVAAGDCPIHRFMQKLAGYQQAYYDLNDYPDKVEHLITVMAQCDKEKVWPVVAKSPARLILHGLHFGAMTPPPIFERYIKPYYQEFSKLLHENGKILTMHADADSRLLLGLIRESGFDMAETFTTHPMVSCTLEAARCAWGSDVIIWGGVPSVILEDRYTDEEFEDYMVNVFKTIAPGDGFILGVADNVMPDARLDRIVRIGRMVEEYGSYPIRM
jgi:hypothetical protein